jgi:hypothetical protein
MKQKSRIYVGTEEQEKKGKFYRNEAIDYPGAEATIEPNLSINNRTNNPMGIPIEA